MERRPENVGILAMEIYFPQTYVNQTELEQFDKVSAGKYTVGLGQKNMAFSDLYEDISSISLTAVHNLLEKYNVDPRSIGRLDIGTETFIDKSKSVKTTLMDLFERYGNNSIEGVTTTNACYGGTAALFNTVAWVESSAWDGRLGLVLASDLAVYERGPARPTGGAGCVAMLIGPNAPIVLEKTRSTFIRNAYDFYKPKLESEYPVVDGKLSIDCYLNAIDRCFSELIAKLKATTNEKFSLKNVDFCCFHTPFGKMVYKSFQRLAFMEIMANSFDSKETEKMELIRKNGNFNDPQLQKMLTVVTAKMWKEKCLRSLLLSSELGNIYTGALYGCLISLVQDESISLENKRILMFSYGSGVASSMFILKVVRSVDFMRSKINIKPRLDARLKISPQEFNDILQKKEELYGKANFDTKVNLDRILKGTYYLVSVDEKYRRKYRRSGGGDYVVNLQGLGPNRLGNL